MLQLPYNYVTTTLCSGDKVDYSKPYNFITRLIQHCLQSQFLCCDKIVGMVVTSLCPIKVCDVVCNIVSKLVNFMGVRHIPCSVLQYTSGRDYHCSLFYFCNHDDHSSSGVPYHLAEINQSSRIRTWRKRYIITMLQNCIITIEYKTEYAVRYHAAFISSLQNITTTRTIVYICICILVEGWIKGKPVCTLAM